MDVLLVTPTQDICESSSDEQSVALEPLLMELNPECHRDNEGESIEKATKNAAIPSNTSLTPP